jgi:hypothetical protein
MDIDVRNLALLVHTFSRRFELSFSFWFFSAASCNYASAAAYPAV